MTQSAHSKPEHKSAFPPVLLRWALPAVVIISIAVLAWLNSDRVPTVMVGTVPLDEVRIVHIPVVNTTETEWKIVSVRSSCPCLSILANPRPVPAGQTVTFPALLRPDKEGVVLVSLELMIDGRADQPVLSRVSAHVVLPEVTSPDRSRPSPAAPVITAAELLTRNHDETRPLIVDVRDTDSFRRSHLPRSINLPPDTLLQSRFARQRELVLVGDPSQSGVLASLAEKLTKEGSPNVRILEGGIVSWLEVGGILSGDSNPRARARHISGAEAWNMVYSDSADLIRISTHGKNPAHIMPVAHTIRLTKGSEGDTATKVAALALEISSGGRPVIISSQSGELYALIEKHLPPRDSSRVHFLEGGMTAAAGFLAQRQHAWMMQTLASELNGLGIGAIDNARTAMRRGCRTCP